jgi:hypothetical protein
MNDRKVLNVARLSMRAARRCVSTYSCRKSRHDFTQPQLIACLVLRAYLCTTYRGVVELLAEMPDVRQAMGLERLPHYTTLQKLNGKAHVVRIVEAMLGEILRSVTGESVAEVRDAAMDSTGLSTTNASVYYRARVLKDSRRSRKQGRYIKISVAIVCGLLMPCALTVAMGPRPDTTETPLLLEQMMRTVRPGALYADRGFDAESIHVTCREHLGVESWVPPVPRTRDGSIRTPNRARMLDLPASYGRRWHVESFFSGLKRTTSGCLSSRNEQALLCDAAFRVLAYAIRR